MKPVLLFMLALSLGCLFEGNALAQEEPEAVVITAVGTSPGDALEKALAEAVAAVTGAILGERSTLVGGRIEGTTSSIQPGNCTNLRSFGGRSVGKRFFRYSSGICRSS